MAPPPENQLPSNAKPEELIPIIKSNYGCVKLPPFGTDHVCRALALAEENGTARLVINKDLSSAALQIPSPFGPESPPIQFIRSTTPIEHAKASREPLVLLADPSDRSEHWLSRTAAASPGMWKVDAENLTFLTANKGELVSHVANLHGCNREDSRGKRQCQVLSAIKSEEVVVRPEYDGFRSTQRLHIAYRLPNNEIGSINYSLSPNYHSDEESRTDLPSYTRSPIAERTALPNEVFLRRPRLDRVEQDMKVTDDFLRNQRF